MTFLLFLDGFFIGMAFCAYCVERGWITRSRPS